MKGLATFMILHHHMGIGVYRPCNININITANEDCQIRIVVEYYALNGSKNETIEETIYNENKRAGEQFVVEFNKTIITDTRRLYPTIRIYNSNNSSTAVNATFTLTQN